MNPRGFPGWTRPRHHAAPGCDRSRRATPEPFRPSVASTGLLAGRGVQLPVTGAKKGSVNLERRPWADPGAPPRRPKPGRTGQDRGRHATEGTGATQNPLPATSRVRASHGASRPCYPHGRGGQAVTRPPGRGIGHRASGRGVLPDDALRRHCSARTREERIEAGLLDLPAGRSRRGLHTELPPPFSPAAAALDPADPLGPPAMPETLPAPPAARARWESLIPPPRSRHFRALPLAGRPSAIRADPLGPLALRMFARPPGPRAAMGVTYPARLHTCMRRSAGML